MSESSAAANYTNALARLEEQRSGAQSFATRANSQIWGSTIANLGQMVAQYPEQRARLEQIKLRGEQAERERKQNEDAGKQQAWLQDVLQRNGGLTRTATAEIKGKFPELGMKYEKALDDAEKSAYDLKSAKHDAKVKELSWVNDHLARVTDQDSYGQFLFTAHLADIDTSQLPPDFDPQMVAQAKRGLLTAQQLAEQDKPKEPKLVPIPNPNGTGAVYGEAVAGQPVYEKPPSQGTAPNAGSFEAFTTETDPTKRAKVLADRKLYNQADDRPRVDVNVNGQGGVGTLDAPGLELAATDYRLTHRLPARNAQQNGAIISAAAAQAKAIGNSPAVTIQKQAAYAGDAKALSKMQSMSASAEAFENKAIAQTDIIKDLSAKVPRTSFPIINAAIQAGRTNITGDENATKLANAIETFSEEYAKVMNGSTGSVAAASDSSRAAAKRLINTAMSKGTMSSVLDLMKREMALTMQGYGAVIGNITERMSGTPATPGTADPKDPLGILR